MPEGISSRTLIISAITSLVLVLAVNFAVFMLVNFVNHMRERVSSGLLLLIVLYSFWEDLKFCVKEIAIKAENFAVLMFIIIVSLTTGIGIINAVISGSVISFLLSDSFMHFNIYIWTMYCQYMRPARFAVKQQIFLPVLIVMITLMTERSSPSVTCSLTAVTVVFLRLSVRVPSYSMMVNQSYSYWITVLIPYVLKPVLILVLVLTPVLSEKRLLVTGIIVIFVQLFHIPSFCNIIDRTIVPLVVAFFVLGTTSASVWVWFSVSVFSATFFIFNSYLVVPVFPFIFAPSVLLAVTVNFSFGFLTASVTFPVSMFLALSVNLPEGKLLTRTLVLGLVMNAILIKCEIIDIMVLMMTLAIILEAGSTPLLICAASKF